MPVFLKIPLCLCTEALCSYKCTHVPVRTPVLLQTHQCSSAHIPVFLSVAGESLGKNNVVPDQEVLGVLQPVQEHGTGQPSRPALKHFRL